MDSRGKFEIYKFSESYQTWLSNPIWPQSQKSICSTVWIHGNEEQTSMQKPPSKDDAVLQKCWSSNLNNSKTTISRFRSQAGIRLWLKYQNGRNTEQWGSC